MSFALPLPGPLRRVCNLPTCDENCTYCRENDRLMAARAGLPFLAPDTAVPSPTSIPRLTFSSAVEPAVEPASKPIVANADTAGAQSAGHPGVAAAQGAVAAGTITPASSEWWAHVLGTTNAPTLEEYNAMTPEQQDAWTCVVCGWEPALADAPQPGRVCSYECLYDKYQ